MLEKLSTHEILTLLESNKNNLGFDSLRQLLAQEVLRRYSKEQSKAELTEKTEEHS